MAEKVGRVVGEVGRNITVRTEWFDMERYDLEVVRMTLRRARGWRNTRIERKKQNSLEDFDAGSG